jgi:CRISPR/Cas system CMR-associated protein Cmr1 (group 7 of RAMP superfamily)
MAIVKLILEQETPLFMGGAAQELEVRAASFRGQLRYWHRALLGAKGVVNLDALIRAEHEVWGGISNHPPAQSSPRLPSLASPVTVFVRHNLIKDDGRAMLPHRQLRSDQLVGPCFWSPLREERKLELVLGTRHPLAPLPVTAIQAALVWATLSGAGRRVRRGFGAFRLIGAEGNLPPGWDNKAFGIDPALARDQPVLLEALRARLHWALGHTCQLAVTPDYPTLAGNKSNVYLLAKPMAVDYEAAMKYFWRDHLRANGVRSAAAFGSGQPRRASPIHVRFTQSAQGYHGLVTYMVTSTDAERRQEVLRHTIALLNSLNSAYRVDDLRQLP